MNALVTKLANSSGIKRGPPSLTPVCLKPRGALTLDRRLITQSALHLCNEKGFLTEAGLEEMLGATANKHVGLSEAQTDSKNCSTLRQS